MADSLSLALRAKIIDVLAGDLSLGEFQDWLVGNTWDVEERGTPADVNMTYEVKLALAEHSRGDIGRQELRERLLPLVETTFALRVGHGS